MAFLAPLFLAALAALAVPVLLHLRRNRPKETVAFSSLMFLEASPPVARRRARLQDVLLLILRCLGLALLVLAFARPFLPADEKSPATAGGSVMNFLLIDASASMNGEPMEAARKIAGEVIEDLPADDWIAVAGFSDELHPLLGPAEAREMTASTRKSSASSVLGSIHADRTTTRLDSALLAAVAAAGEDAPVTVHLISDFQRGAAIERIRDETWPDHVQVVPHPVARAEGWTNAGVGILAPDGKIQRVRVSNSEGSAKSDFSLTWGASGEAAKVIVPAGESAVFDSPEGLPVTGRLSLTGDDFDFDNQAEWQTPVLPVARVWCPDPIAADDQSESAYFMTRAMRSTADYEVEITATRPADPAALTYSSGCPDEASLAALKTTLETGGTALFTMPDVGSAASLVSLLGIPSDAAEEAVVADHARLGEIDFNSSVFGAFADARYSDFSGIRVWKYRILPEALASRGKVLARFDSGDPAWLEFEVGEGSLHVLTTTWRPADSQLALTTKFPPLLHALLQVPPSSDDAPAAGLDPSESELTPLSADELRGLGLPLDPVVMSGQRAGGDLSNLELERRQRFGWWLLIAAAAVFLLETSWAAFAGVRRSPVIA